MGLKRDVAGCSSRQCSWSTDGLAADVWGQPLFLLYFDAKFAMSAINWSAGYVLLVLFDATLCQLPGHKLRKWMYVNMILRLWFGAYLKLGPRANSLKKTRQLGSDWARVSTRKVDGHWPPGTICGQKVAIWVFEHLGPFSSGNLTALLRINIEKNDFPEGCPVARGSGPRCLFLTSSFLNAGPFKALQPLYFFVGQMWLQRNGRTFAGIVDPPSIVYLINFVSCQFWLPTSCWKEFKPKDLCEKMVKAENRWCQIWKNGYCKLL